MRNVVPYFQLITVGFRLNAPAGPLCKADRHKQGRKERPTGALIDSQSVKTAKEASEVGFDGGKKVKGTNAIY